MSALGEGLYIGAVVHKRLTPRHHALRYTVFSCLFDCSRLDSLSARLRLFSLNHFNLFSLHERDHTEGQSLNSHLSKIARESGHGRHVARFLMLCYPRVLGYSFNPLTIYYGLDASDRIRLMVYEVRNTFGECMTYVLPVEPSDDEIITQDCRKRFYVSPFNSVEGHYTFHATRPSEQITIGVAHKTESGPILKAHFRGDRLELSDANLIRALWRTGWMTAKVIVGIHYEALKLWIKGMRLVPRPSAPRRAITYLEKPRESV